jgi:two-component system, response regulator PdtaR
MRFMIVEDNALAVVDLQEILEAGGHEVVGVAATADEAKRIGWNGVDLALVDIVLADGSSGVDVAEHLARQHGIPSLFVTATLPSDPRVLQYGVGYLGKPYDERGVLRAIAAAVDTVGAARQEHCQDPRQEH